MPISGQSIGRDVSLVFNIGGNQLVFPADFVTSFEAKPDAQLKKYLPISGIINTGTFHEGWSIDMEVARINAELDARWAELEAAYYAGVNTPAGVIFETITESDGSVSQFVYTNFQMKVDTMGMWKGNDFISQKISGYASRREPTF